ncbi:hypothetical protein Sjap_015651 [Stephania japonica]|uniref:Uncharacterized protein n=1 Tax=Stephania japonica TaxID=461633 RepID=A0AAP0IJL0_9MAGN
MRKKALASSEGGGFVVCIGQQLLESNMVSIGPGSSSIERVLDAFGKPPLIDLWCLSGGPNSQRHELLNQCAGLCIIIEVVGEMTLNINAWFHRQTWWDSSNNQFEKVRHHISCVRITEKQTSRQRRGKANLPTKEKKNYLLNKEEEA